MPSINLDITHRCTLQCSRCWRKYYDTVGEKVPGHDMTMEEYAKIIDYFDDIIFCGNISDPIFHPQFPQMLQMVHQCEVHTAAPHKPDAWYDIAFDANKNAQWIFGIDGLPKDSHKYRVNQDGEKLYRMMTKAAKAGIQTWWQYIVFNYNEDDIDEAIQMSKDIGVKFRLIESSRFKDNDPMRPSKHYIERNYEEFKTKMS